MTIETIQHSLNPGTQRTESGISVLQTTNEVEPKAPEQQPLEHSQENSQLLSMKSAEKSQEQDVEDLQKAVSNINDFVQKTQRDLEFSIDDVSGRSVVKVIDTKSEEVIRQIPTEEMLDLARHLTGMNEDSALQEISIFSSIA